MQPITRSTFGLVFAASLLLSKSVSAITIEEFNNICASAPMPCTEIPFLQAYVGGSLDMLAALDESTNYLGEIYCRPARELFDTTKIIEFMQAHKDDAASRNAMVLVIQYLEEQGRCNN